MSKVKQFLRQEDADITVVLWFCIIFLTSFFIYAPFHIAGKI